MAGDAVHLFTPSGGFGMNTGIDDAANLGWKLAGMVQGWGGPRLLESYEIERRPIAFRNTGAVQSARPATSARRRSARTSTSRRRPASGRGARPAHYLSGGRPEFASLGVQLGARYDDSPIIVSDGTPPPADDLFDYRPSGVPGGRAPHVWTGEGRDIGDSLFDSFGPGFTVLRLGPRPPQADGLLAAFASAQRAGPRGRRAKSGGARSLRTRYRGGAAGPACRLARQCRSARRRPMSSRK